MLNTVKLPESLQAELEEAAESRGISKSALIREALRKEIARTRRARRPSAFELGADLFGTARSGHGKLSMMRARDIVAPKKRAKAAHR